MEYAVNILGFILAVSMLLFGATGCTEIHVRPIAGMMGTQCVFPTEVYCDDVLSEHTCQFVDETTTFWNGQSPTAKHFFTYMGRVHIDASNAKEFLVPNRVVVTLLEQPNRIDPFSEAPQALLKTVNVVETESFCRVRTLVIFQVHEHEFSEGSLAQALRHEFGHVLGLPDVTIRGCLMYGATEVTLEEPQNNLCNIEDNLMRAAYY